MDSLDLFVRRSVHGPPTSPQGWPAYVDHIPRRMLRIEEKVTRAPTSQQSAGHRDVASGEVIRNNDVGGAGVCMGVISLSRLSQTPPPKPRCPRPGLWFHSSMYHFAECSRQLLRKSQHHARRAKCGQFACFCSPQWWRQAFSKHDTTSKHSYTWSHCTSRVKQLRGDAVLAI